MKKTFVYSSILSLIAIFFRFSYSIPVAFLDDSVKYKLPLSIIQANNFEWMFGTINFSLLNRIIAYFIQINSNGEITGIIILQKLLGIISTLICFYLIYKLTKKPILAFVLSLIFTINPFILFIENTVMAESLFIFTAAISSLFLFKLLEIHSLKSQIILAALLGFALSASALAKETGWIWSICVLIVLIIKYFWDSFSSKRISLVLINLVLVLCYAIPFLQIASINKKNFGEFTVNRFSTKGVILYIMTEDMLRNNPHKDYIGLSKIFISTTDSIRNKYKEHGELSAYDHQRAFYNAISRINVQGRGGAITLPNGKRLSSKEWASLCFNFAIDTSLKNPKESLKRIIDVSIPNFFFSKNYTFNHERKSQKLGLDLEPLQFTQVPFSLTKKVDSEINKQQLLEGKFQINKYLKDKSKIIYLVNRNTNKAFFVDKPFVIRWLDLFQNNTFILLTFPILLLLMVFTLISIIKNRDSIKFNLYETYILLSLIYFTVFQVALSQCEGRYRIQLQFFLMLSIALFIHKLVNRNKQDFT